MTICENSPELWGHGLCVCVYVCVYMDIQYASPTSTDRQWEVAEQRPEGEQLRVTIERLKGECGT